LGVFSERHTQEIVYQLVEAVLSCNRHGIAHRDIKLSNITFPPPQQTFSYKRQRYQQQQRHLQMLVQQQQQQQQQGSNFITGRGAVVAVSVGDSIITNDNIDSVSGNSVGGHSAGGSLTFGSVSGGSVTGCSSVSYSVGAGAGAGAGVSAGIYGLTRSPSR
jgi:serine/threonine protein kinase